MVIKKLSYPINVRNISRKDKIVFNKEELFEHLCGESVINNPRPLHIKMLAGKLVDSSSGKVEDNSVISPDLFINENTILFMNLFNRYKRYGWTPLYDGYDIPNIVLEAFDCIENTIAEYEASVYKTQKIEAEKTKKDSQNKTTRKSLPK